MTLKSPLNGIGVWNTWRKSISVDNGLVLVKMMIIYWYFVWNYERKNVISVNIASGSRKYSDAVITNHRSWYYPQIWQGPIIWSHMNEGIIFFYDISQMNMVLFCFSLYVIQWMSMLWYILLPLKGFEKVRTKRDVPWYISKYHHFGLFKEYLYNTMDFF